MSGLYLALSFLTTLPLPAPRAAYDPRQWGMAALYFPWIGALIGAAGAVVGMTASGWFSGWLAAVLSVAAWVALSGGLHLDGLADCCDGLLAPLPPARRLEIMRDPTVGTFGATGLSLFLFLKVGAVQGVLQGQHLLALPAAAALGRAALLWLARQPGARAGGMGATFAEQIGRRHLLLTLWVPLLLLLLTGSRGVVAMLVAAAGALAVAALARQRIGGVTGDVFGLGVEVVELLVLLVHAAR